MFVRARNFSANSTTRSIKKNLKKSKKKTFIFPRREVYRILEEAGLDVPRYAIFNRDENGKPCSGATKEIEENDDTIIVNGNYN